MMISLIVALGKNREIGLKCDLPWRLTTDLQRFKNITIGHHLIMGRKTFESIGRPLPGRDTIVITQDPHYSFPERGVFIAHSLDEALQLAERRGETEVFVCGGGRVYQEALPLADCLYLTEVDYEGEADTFFPSFDAKVWEVTKEEFIPAGPKDPYSSTFKILQKTASSNGPSHSSHSPNSSPEFN